MIRAQSGRDDDLVRDTRRIMVELKSALVELKKYTDELEEEVQKYRRGEDAGS